MNLKRLLTTPTGRIFISIILGLGLATFFRRVCKDKNCIVFHGPIISEFEDKIYQYGDKCYSYRTKSDKCDAGHKKVLDIRDMPSEQDLERDKSMMPKILSGASPVAAAPPSGSSFFQKMTQF